MTETRHIPIQVITRSAILLAIVLAAQALHLPQAITGPIVNAVLIIAVLSMGITSGIVLAILVVLGSFFLGFMKVPLPQMIPLIMIANLTLVIIFNLLKGNNYARNIIGLIAGALLKAFVFFLALHYVFSWLGITVPEPLFAAFGIIQLYTALAGGIIAILIYRLITAKK